MHTDQTADRTRQTNEPIIEVRESKCRSRDRKIADVGDKLQVDRRTLPVTIRLQSKTFDKGRGILLNPLTGNNALPILLIQPRLLLSQVIKRVSSRDSAEQQPNHPASIRLLLQPLSRRTLPDPRSIQERQGIKRHVPRISKLSADSTVLDDRI